MILGSKGNIKDLFDHKYTDEKHKFWTWIPDIDIDAIRKYNNSLMKAQGDQEARQKAYNNTLLETKGATRSLIESYGGEEIALEQLTLGYKAAAVGRKIFYTAMNMALVAVASAAISKLINLVQNWIKEQELVSEAAQKALENYNQLLDSATANAKEVDNLAESYTRLSRGVNNLGENVSLTDEEFKEYNNLVNDIASKFPDLVSGYTQQGNAVINLSDAYSELTEKANEATEAAYNALIANNNGKGAKDVIDNWNNLNKTSYFRDLDQNDVGGVISYNEAVSVLNKLRTENENTLKRALVTQKDGTLIAEQDLSNVEKSYRRYNLFLEKNLNNGNVFTEDNFDINLIRKKAASLVLTYNKEVQTRLKGVNSVATAYLKTDDRYKNSSEEIQKYASIFASNLTQEIVDKIAGEDNKLSEAEINTWTDNLLSFIYDPEIYERLDNIANFDPNRPAKEVASEINNYLNEIMAIIAENDLFKNLGITEDFILDRLSISITNSQDELNNKIYEASGGDAARGSLLYRYTKDFNQSEIENFLNVYKTGMLPSEWISAYEDLQKTIADTFNIETYKDNIDNFQTNLSSISGYLETLAKDGRLSGEQMTDLQQEFKDLDYETEDLSTVLKNEAISEFDNLIAILGENAPTTLISSIRDQLYNILSANDVDNVINNKVRDILQKEYIKGYIPPSALEDMINANSVSQYVKTLNIAEQAAAITYMDTPEGKLMVSKGAEAFKTAFEAYLNTNPVNLFTGAQTNILNNYKDLLSGSGDAIDKLMHDELKGIDLLSFMNDNPQYKDAFKDIINGDKSLDELDDIIRNKIISDLDELAKELNIDPDSEFFKQLKKDTLDSAIGIGKVGNEIDRLKGKFSTYYDYLNKLNTNSFSMDDWTTLFSDPKFLEAYNGDLNETLTKLFNEQISEIYNNIREIAPEYADELIANLQLAGREAEFAAKGINTMSDALGNLQDTFNFKNDVIKEITDTGRISISTLNSIMEKYPNIVEEVQEYMLDETQENLDRIQDALNDQYDTDYKNYCEYIKYKTLQDADFYNNNILPNLPEWVNKLADHYKIDLNNYSHYINAKQNLDKQYLATEKRLEAERYKDKMLKNQSIYEELVAEAKTLKGDQKEYLLAQANSYHDIAGMYFRKYEDAMREVSAYNQISQALEGVFEAQFADNIDKIGSNLNTSLKNEWDKTNSDSSSDMDWIQVLLSRIQRTITNLGNTVSATWKSWGKRNTALIQEMTQIHTLINANQAGAQKYLEAFNKVNLSSDYKEKIKNGTLQIEKDINSDTYDLISEAQGYWENYLQCLDDAEQGYSDLADAAQTSFDLINTRFDKQISQIEHSSNVINEVIAQVEARGYLVSSNYYRQLISDTQSQKALLQQELNELIASRDKAVADGNIEIYSEQWYGMTESINGVDEAIRQCDTSLIEFSNNIRQLDWDAFDLGQEYISQVTQEVDFLRELFDENELFADNGAWQSGAKSTAGLTLIGYDTYMKQADDYAKEVEKLNKQIANDPYNKDLIARRNELLKLQQDSIKSARSEREAIRDLYSKGYDKLINRLKEVSDAYMDVINKTDDLKDYSKNISDQIKNINNIQKQIMSLSGDDSEENRAQLQKLQVSLTDAREQLEETEHERWKSDQQQMLDNLQDQTQEWVNERLDNIDLLFNEAIQNANINKDEIKTTIETESSEVGYQLTTEVDRILTMPGNMVSLYTTSDYANNVVTTLQNINQFIVLMTQYSAKTNDLLTGLNLGGSSNTEKSSANPAPIATDVISNNSNTNKPVTNTPSSISTAKPVTNATTTSKWGSWFKYKKNLYPKEKLNIDTSIQDRLAYFDIDPAFEARAQYYKAMGGTGTYTGSASQNIWMIKQMKANGYAKGGKSISDKWAWTQENGQELIRTSDGALLTPVKGADVFTAEQSHLLWDLSKSLVNGNTVDTSKVNGYSSAIEFSGNIIMNGVNDPEKFAHELANALNTNTMIKKIVQANTTDLLIGKNSLSGRRYN